jgi:iron(III) transport system ATP-binding protein
MVAVPSRVLNRDEMSPETASKAPESHRDGAASLREVDNAAIRIVNLEKYFRREKGDHVAAIDHVSLEVERGSMVTVLGPSGCGKTTLLRCIAGLETPTGGEIWADGQLLSSGARGIVVPPERRQFGMMFQSYAVWPHMSVFANVGYPLKVRRWSKARIAERVATILGIVGIEHLRNEYPARMSGGQQQRVALARSLVNDPKVMLFDEPLSNVDAKVREELRVELLAMQQEIGFAGVYVTHDQEEAMAISDRIVVMHEGKALQVGSPREIYGRPASRFVASFIGIANMWEGVLDRDDEGSATATVTCEIGAVAVAAQNVPAELEGNDVVVVARPEAVTVSDRDPGALGHGNVWRGTLRTEMFRGSHSEFFVEVNGRIVRGRGSHDFMSGQGDTIAVGDEVFVVAPPHKLRVLSRLDPAWAKVASSADRPRSMTRLVHRNRPDRDPTVE